MSSEETTTQQCHPCNREYDQLSFPKLEQKFRKSNVGGGGGERFKKKGSPREAEVPLQEGYLLPHLASRIPVVSPLSS